MIGDERTTRTPRTRLGLRIVQQRLDGTDGLGPGGAFTPKQLMHAVFNDRQYLGELWRDQLVKMCDAHPTITGSSGPVDVSKACPVLAAWSKHDNLLSRGALLFRRFAARADLAVPNGAVHDAVQRLGPGQHAARAEHRRPADPARAGRRGHRRPRRGPAARRHARRGRSTTSATAKRIPIHGGPDELGLFNVISVAVGPEGRLPRHPSRARATCRSSSRPRAARTRTRSSPTPSPPTRRRSGTPTRRGCSPRSSGSPGPSATVRSPPIPSCACATSAAAIAATRRPGRARGCCAA